MTGASIQTLTARVTIGTFTYIHTYIRIVFPYIHLKRRGNPQLIDHKIRGEVRQDCTELVNRERYVRVLKHATVVEVIFS